MTNKYLIYKIINPKNNKANYYALFPGCTIYDACKYHERSIENAVYGLARYLQDISHCEIKAARLDNSCTKELAGFPQKLNKDEIAAARKLLAQAKKEIFELLKVERAEEKKWLVKELALAQKDSKNARRRVLDFKPSVPDELCRQELSAKFCEPALKENQVIVRFGCTIQFSWLEDKVWIRYYAGKTNFIHYSTNWVLDEEQRCKMYKKFKTYFRANLNKVDLCVKNTNNPDANWWFVTSYDEYFFKIFTVAEFKKLFLS